jgi:hypothetical protein
MNWLNGKKTYIGMALLGILMLIDHGTGWGLYDVPDALLVTIGTLTGVSLRHGVEKSGTPK